MRLVEIKCPCCNANIRVDEGKNTVCCQFCGTQIYVDDGVKRSEHTYKKVNETRLIESENEKQIRLSELEYEERENKRNSRMILALILILFLMPAIIYGGLFFKDMKVRRMESAGMISAGNSSDYEGKNYIAVVSQLEAIGFTDIETIDLDDAGIFINKADTVENVKIKGKAYFTDSDYFYPDDKVIVTYH